MLTSLVSSASTNCNLTRAVIPLAPASVVAGDPVPSTVTFVFPEAVEPGTWYIEMDHETNHVAYSLRTIHKNEFSVQYELSTKSPHLIGGFTDAWVTTHHRVAGHVHFMQNLYHPEKADNKLYFSRPPYHRIEVIVPGLIEDREIFRLLEGVVPKEYEIEKLLQRQS